MKSRELQTEAATESSQQRVAASFAQLTLIPFVCLTLTGCWGTKKLDMMSSPLIHQQLGASAYGNTTSEACKPMAELFYATNRPGSGANTSRKYGNGSTDGLHLGLVEVQRGDASMTWDKLVQLSISDQRDQPVPLRIRRAREVGVLEHSDAPSFSEALDHALSSRSNGELTIFVPGSASSFYKSCAHATQLYHFTAPDGVFLTFSWPSTGKFVTYHRDVQHAAAATPLLADLIEQVARSSKVRRINIFAYSAGAQVAAPALASLRARYPDKTTDELRRRFRIGNVYLAAPDVSTRKFFTEYLPGFRDIVAHTTFTYARYDPILKVSHVFQLEARAGRPSRFELKKKKEQELEWLRQANQHPAVDAIDTDYSEAQRQSTERGHGSWYTDPWVSSDVVFLLRQDKPAISRGLEQKTDGSGWYFPEDYPERLKNLCSRRQVPEA